MSNTNNTKYHNQFWREFDQVKIHSFYLQYLLRRTENIDRYINIFMAITSSVSIGSWVIWQNLSFIWGTAIAISQVITAVNAYLPYKKRIRPLYGLSNDYEKLALLMEKQWYFVSEGTLSDARINKLRMESKTKQQKIFEKYAANIVLPEDAKLYEKSKSDATEYMKQFFG